MSNKSAELPWVFRLQAQLIPDADGRPRPEWTVHTAVKPQPGMELYFTVESVKPEDPA